MSAKASNNWATSAWKVQMLINQVKKQVGPVHSLVSIYVFSITEDEKDYIRQNLIDIASPFNEDVKYQDVAKELLDFFESKSKDGQPGSTEYGAVAEFLLTLVSRHLGFQQGHSYRNLEENSIKKGFDGVYLDVEKNVWLLESKSTFTQDNRGGTISLAKNGLKDFVTGNTENDPWRNAVAHAMARENRNKSLIDKLKNIERDYRNENYMLTTDVRAILGSTVFTTDTSYSGNTVSDLSKIIYKHEFLEEIVLAMNVKDVDLLKDILKELGNE